jgi:hypothetical protein
MITTAHFVIVAVTRLETIAKGTACVALLASSAIVAPLSNPETGYNPDWRQETQHKCPSITNPIASSTEIREYEICRVLEFRGEGDDECQKHPELDEDVGHVELFEDGGGDAC